MVHRQSPAWTVTSWNWLIVITWALDRASSAGWWLAGTGVAASGAAASVSGVPRAEDALGCAVLACAALDSAVPACAVLACAVLGVCSRVVGREWAVVTAPCVVAAWAEDAT